MRRNRISLVQLQATQEAKEPRPEGFFISRQRSLLLRTTTSVIQQRRRETSRRTRIRMFQRYSGTRRFRRWNGIEVTLARLGGTRLGKATRQEIGNPCTPWAEGLCRANSILRVSEKRIHPKVESGNNRQRNVAKPRPLSHQGVLLPGHVARRSSPSPPTLFRQGRGTSSLHHASSMPQHKFPPLSLEEPVKGGAQACGQPFQSISHGNAPALAAGEIRQGFNWRA